MVRGDEATSSYPLPSAHLARICQKPDPGEGSAWQWASQPALRGNGPVGEGGGEHRPVFGDSATRRSAICEDEHAADTARHHPPALLGDLGSEPRLAVKDDQRCLGSGTTDLTSTTSTVCDGGW